MLGVAYLSSVAPSSGAETGVGPAVSDGSVWSQADRYFDPDDMKLARSRLLHGHGGVPSWFVMLEELETRIGADEDLLVLDGEAWFGDDLNKARLGVHGVRSLTEDEFEDVRAQFLWSRAVSPYWDIYGGLTHDFEPNDLSFATVGAEGLAPYLLEVDAYALLSAEGDVALQAHVEHDLYITQRLVLGASALASYSLRDAPELEERRGSSTVGAGLRLRYEFIRELAPYVGVQWERATGPASHHAGENADGNSRYFFVAGLRIWF